MGNSKENGKFKGKLKNLKENGKFKGKIEKSKGKWEIQRKIITMDNYVWETLELKHLM